MHITVRQMELFISLMHTPHIGKVAEKHFLTQSAVSMSLKALEESVGVQLFDRINKRLVPNENGFHLLSHIEPALARLGEAETIFQQNRMAGTIRIAASSTIADYILPQVLYNFRTLYPEARVEMQSRNSAEVVADVEQGRIALGFVEGDYESSLLEFKQLCREELVVVSSDKEFASAREYSLEELMDMQWILRERGSGTRQTMWEHVGAAKKKLNIYLELDHIESIKMVLKNPGTISCMSPFCLQRELKTGDLFPVQVEEVHFSRSFYAVWHKNKYQSSLMTAFVDAVRDHLKNLGPLSLPIK